MYYFNVQTFPTAPNLLDLHQEITKTVKDRSAKVNTSIAGTLTQLVSSVTKI